ncbi:MAG TPA: hypothetical protein VGR03_09585, partial [Candidatus Acidoferrum sp.]|nr:hypothetical protein [Candidatus Acidoferrum sp.]
VGILTGTRKDVLVAAGDRGPLPNQRGQGEWGDYLTVRPAFPNQKLFAATGYTLKGPGDGSNRDSTPRFVIFGRAEDAGGAAVPAGGGGAGGGGVVPVGGGGGTPPVGGGGGGAGPVVGVVGPFTDVNQLPVVSASVAAEIKAAVGIPQGPSPHALEAAMLPELVTKPGAERWQVKTGQDDDVGTVGMNVINGQDLGEGIVEATLEEMVRIPRPPQMANVTLPYRNFDRQRQSFTEKTIWRIEVTITDLKREADGDYHLVLKGASGETMIGEVPTATTTFVGNSPWLENITEARKEVDDKIVSQLSPASFALMDGVWVPRGSMSVQPQDTRRPPDTFCTPPEGSEQQMQPFKTQISPRRVRLTGVGLFDRVHNQTGVSQSNGIELHPILKIEWL